MCPRDHNLGHGDHKGGLGTTMELGDHNGTAGGMEIIMEPRGHNGGLGTTRGPGTTTGSGDQERACMVITMGPRDHKGAWGPQWGLHFKGAHDHNGGPGNTRSPWITRGLGTTMGPKDHNRTQDHNGAWGLQGGLGTTMGHRTPCGVWEPQGRLSIITRGPGDHKGP